MNERPPEEPHSPAIPPPPRHDGELTGERHPPGSSQLAGELAWRLVRDHVIVVYVPTERMGGSAGHERIVGATAMWGSW